MMRIMNNSSAMMALGETKKNQKALDKQLKKVASGMKINGAGDGASEYSISEKMRVRIRSLGQNEQNVKTGQSLLQVAEGGVQSQLNILRTIKEKVINAHNDTNTDLDRATIQKEIDQGYDQMEAVTYDTDYNRKHLLIGDTYHESVFSWDVLDKAVMVEGSDMMQVIPDKYQTLDGVEGPFDIFTEWGTRSSTIDQLNLQSSQNFSGAADGTAATFTMDFSSYSSASQLNGVGFNVANYTYVLSNDTSKNYSASKVINITGCNTPGDVVNKIVASGLNYVTVTASGSQLKITTNAKTAAANNTTVAGYSRAATSTSGTSGTPAVSGTGFFNPAKSLSGGTNSYGDPNSTDPDAGYYAGTKASLTVNMSGVAADTGITVSGSGTAKIKFVAGSDGFNTSGGVTTVGINYTGSATRSLAGMTVSYSNGKITFTANNVGTYANSYSVSDGIAATTGSSAVNYSAITAFNGTITNHQTGSDGTTATYTVDLSNVPETTSTTDLEQVINNLSGKGITYNGYTYEFIDSGNAMSLDNATKISGARGVDLNALRSAVASGTDIKTALQNLLLSKLGQSSATGDDVLLTTTVKGSAANNQTLTVREGKLRSYDIDYSAWFASHSGDTIPNSLYDKGFRFYCATDPGQWFYIIFTDGSPAEADKPASGTEGQDIKSISVDVSAVRSASDLVKAIYDQTMPVLTGPDKNFNHHYRVAADTYNGILTIYDQRAYNVNTPAYQYQDRGAKIADGVLDNVIKSERQLLVDDIIIQHTDHSSQNIHVKIPRMTSDHIFGYKPSVDDIRNYSVTDKVSREKLLGRPPEEGLLDKGINYILDAATLIGAQNKRLQQTEANIVNSQENTIASESTIRDADMAKEMTDYAKANILSQTSQSMLAQANQNSSSVLSLLQ